MEKLAHRDGGSHDRPPVLLWHGGAGPEQTWSTQWALVEHWHLLVPWRRGFDPSPRCERQDWERDVGDLMRFAPAGSHLIAHSYGGVSAAVAAALDPRHFASLTLIEPPLWFVAENDPRVRELAELARTVSAPDVDATTRDRFRRLASLAPDHEETLRIEQRATGFRDPGDARPDLGVVRRSGLASFVVSGGHDAGLERLCDALALALDGRRAALPGRGHAVQRHPAFNARLEEFLRSLP
jgi:pimeloyl-ACP methyl ester carboxylesterase